MKFSPGFCDIFLGIFFVAKSVFSREYGIVEITSKNYQSLVINEDREAWIVAVKGAGKISPEKWEDLEYKLRGLFVRVGIIDPNKDGAFLKKKVGRNWFFSNVVMDAKKCPTIELCAGLVSMAFRYRLDITNWPIPQDIIVTSPFLVINVTYMPWACDVPKLRSLILPEQRNGYFFKETFGE